MPVTGIELTQASDTLTVINVQVQQRLGALNVHAAELKEALVAHDLAEKDVKDHEAAAAVLSGLEKTWRGTFEQALSDVAGQGLSAVFGKSMEVGLETTTKRNAASTDITLTTDGLKTRVKGAKGGSVAQVFAAQLRQLLTLAQRPEARLLLMLDEPFSMVSVGYRPALCAMLREMSDKLGFQWLFTSHEDEMLDAADTAYLVHSDGKATAEAIKTQDEVRV